MGEVTKMFRLTMFNGNQPEFYIPSGYLTVRHGIDGPNRNRWFTEQQKMGGSFQFANCYIVITRW